jgi:hypothetical protein
MASMLYSLVRVVLDAIATSHSNEAKLRVEVLALRRQVQRGRGICHSNASGLADTALNHWRSRLMLPWIKEDHRQLRDTVIP